MMMKSKTRLLLVLLGLVALRCIALILGHAGAGNTPSALVTCLLFCALYLALSPKTEEKKPPFKDLKKGALLLLFFLSASIFFSSLSSLIFPVQDVKISLFRVIVAVALVPLSEELFFRETLFKTLDTLCTPLFSILLSSVIFAICHASPPAMITAFFTGALLSVIYKKTDSLILCALCHTVNNLIAATVHFPKTLTLPLILLSFVLCVFFVKKGFLKIDG